MKHANPCGVAIAADSLVAAYEKAFLCDKTSAFGGIIAVNCELAQATAERIIANQFVEVILCPSAEAGASEAVGKKKNVRLLQYTVGGEVKKQLEYFS